MHKLLREGNSTTWRGKFLIEEPKNHIKYFSYLCTHEQNSTKYSRLFIYSTLYVLYCVYDAVCSHPQLQWAVCGTLSPLCYGRGRCIEPQPHIVAIVVYTFYIFELVCRHIGSNGVGSIVCVACQTILLSSANLHKAAHYVSVATSPSYPTCIKMNVGRH